MSGDLVEVSDVRQIPGEARRRWFSSQAMDLILWHGESGEITSFQLCYDKLYRERAIIWQLGRRELVHMTVDDGESVGLRHKATPILVADSAFCPADVLRNFTEAAAGLPQEVVSAVVSQLGRESR